MPKALMSDIRTGSIELEEQELELDELDNAYYKDKGKAENQTGSEQAPVPNDQPSGIENVQAQPQQ
jgi:hypothetical protein